MRSGGDRFEPERFELVRASPTAGLLRLFGKWPGNAAPAKPILVVSRGRRRERLTPLPQPREQATLGSWGAAFSIPLELAEDRKARFELARPPGDRVVARLPAPTDRDGKGSAMPESRSLLDRLIEYRERAAERRLANARRKARGLGRHLAGERSARLATERAAEAERGRAELVQRSLTDELRRVQLERVQLREQLAERTPQYEAELEEVRGDAERRAVALEKVSARLGRVRSELEHELHKATRRLAVVREQLERELRARATLESEARAGIERLEGQLAELRERAAALEADLAAERQRRADLEELVAVERANVEARTAAEVERETSQLRSKRTELEDDIVGLRARLEGDMVGLRARLEAELVEAQEAAEARELALASDLGGQLAERTRLLEELRAELAQRADEVGELEHDAAALRSGIAGRLTSAQQARARRFGRRRGGDEQLRAEVAQAARELAELEREMTLLRDAVAARMRSDRGLPLQRSAG